jgi:hypothetical protein
MHNTGRCLHLVVRQDKLQLQVGWSGAWTWSDHVMHVPAKTTKPARAASPRICSLYPVRRSGCVIGSWESVGVCTVSSKGRATRGKQSSIDDDVLCWIKPEQTRRMNDRKGARGGSGSKRKEEKEDHTQRGARPLFLLLVHAHTLRRPYTGVRGELVEAGRSEVVVEQLPASRICVAAGRGMEEERKGCFACMHDAPLLLLVRPPRCRRRRAFLRGGGHGGNSSLL